MVDSMGHEGDVRRATWPFCRGPSDECPEVEEGEREREGGREREGDKGKVREKKNWREGRGKERKK